MPNYVANKAYYTEAVAPLDVQGNAPFYIVRTIWSFSTYAGRCRLTYTNTTKQTQVPSAKYEFDHPEGTGHASSPFFSIWFCHLGPDPQACAAILPWLEKQQQQQGGSWRVVLSEEGLREAGAAPAWKRLSNKRRKKMKMQQQRQQAVVR
jgi:hypothetical protein